MEPTSSPAPSKATILFDGDCAFCSAAVRLIRSGDSGDQFVYTSLDSDAGRALLAAGGRDPAAEPALVLIDDAGLHAASDAALRIARRLRAPWNVIARLAHIVPRPLRETAYWMVAHSRRRLPG